MAGFSLSAVVGNRIDKKDDHDNGSGDFSTSISSSKSLLDSDEGVNYTVTKTEDTEAHDYGRESPVHMMTDKQLRRERVGGYLIGLFAVLFIAFLVSGYMMTMDVPLCICENANYTQTGECQFTQLSEQQQKQCSGN